MKVNGVMANLMDEGLKYGQTEENMMVPGMMASQ